MSLWSATEQSNNPTHYRKQDLGKKWFQSRARECSQKCSEPILEHYHKQNGHSRTQSPKRRPIKMQPERFRRGRINALWSTSKAKANEFDSKREGVKKIFVVNSKQRQRKTRQFYQTCRFHYDISSGGDKPQLDDYSVRWDEEIKKNWTVQYRNQRVKDDIWP